MKNLEASNTSAVQTNAQMSMERYRLLRRLGGGYHCNSKLIKLGLFYAYMGAIKQVCWNRSNREVATNNG
jgi:hypothetical protein